MHQKKGGQTRAVIQDKQLLEAAFNADPDAIAIIDPDHKIVRINRSMAARLDMMPEQCIGLTCHELVHGTDSPPPFCPLTRLLEDGSEQRAEVHEPRMGGTFIVTVSPLLGDKGQLQGGVHIARNITERKKMEDDLLLLNRNLQAANKELQAAYQWMRNSRDRLRNRRYEDALGFLVDREGRIEWLSAKILEYAGQSRDKLIASDIVDLFEPSCRDDLKQALKQAWIGIVNPIKVEICFARAKERVFEAKISGLLSAEQRRLWVSLEHWPSNTGQGIES